MSRARIAPMAPVISRIISILVGLLVGMFFVALLRSGSLTSLNGLTFLCLVLGALIVLRLLVTVDLLLIVGVIVGGLLVLLVQDLSPAQLSGEQLMLALIVVILALRT